MRILIVNFGDSLGGASVAASRLQNCLTENDIDSKFLVLNKKANIFGTYTINRIFSKFIFFLAKLENKLIKQFYPNKSTNRFSLSLLNNRKITSAINTYNPDLVHLHWVQSGMLSVKDISKIKKPIVWSLHDVWAFTGGCHYNESCMNFQNSCGSCKILGSNKFSDLSQFVFKSKIKAYEKHGNITFVGLSKWMTNLAISSPLTNKKVINLPNPIDTNIYKPSIKENNPLLTEINPKINNILVGAISLKIKRKGFKEFIDAVEYIANDFDLITFGVSNANSIKIKQRRVNVGFISKTRDMVSLYSIVSVTVVPSLEENLSNVIMESLACGTPVVAFDIGGNSDLITHKVNGYLATPFDVRDLAQGIDWVLNNKDKLNLSENCIDKVKQEFDYSVVAEKFIDLYKNILNK